VNTQPRCPPDYEQLRPQSDSPIIGKWISANPIPQPLITLYRNNSGIL